MIEPKEGVMVYNRLVRSARSLDLRLASEIGDNLVQLNL